MPANACPECGAPIAWSTKTCPRCGHTVDAHMMRFLGFVVVAFMLLGLIGNWLHWW